MSKGTNKPANDKINIVLPGELLQKGIESEHDAAEVPAALDKARTIELLKEANDKSFEAYKDYAAAVKAKDPYLTPVVVS